ncbi:MAG TPA: hypothetical protein VLV54_14655 [Thermoanaerobaculia bacterium]|nr:hypothetical protein [Thermoanaerobaculia bacterium]
MPDPASPETPAPATPAVPGKLKRLGTPMLLAAIVVLILLVAYLTEHRFLFLPAIQRPFAFLVIIVLLTLFALLAGRTVTGLFWGLLIDDRNKMSLSRFQTALWTVVVVSAILVAAFSNVGLEGQGKITKDKAGKRTLTLGKQELLLAGDGPLDFEIPQDLWLVLGISVASLVGSPMIRQGKKDQQPKPEELAKTESTLKTQGQDVAHEGLVIVNTKPADARWGDLFQGEETGNGAHLDLGKVQNFYFTLILVFAYGAALAALFAKPEPIVALPAFSQGAVALLGISHAAYLANKARPQSQTAS